MNSTVIILAAILLLAFPLTLLIEAREVLLKCLAIGACSAFVTWVAAVLTRARRFMKVGAILAVLGSSAAVGVLLRGRPTLGELFDLLAAQWGISFGLLLYVSRTQQSSKDKNFPDPDTPR